MKYAFQKKKINLFLRWTQILRCLSKMGKMRMDVIKPFEYSGQE